MNQPTREFVYYVVPCGLSWLFGSLSFVTMFNAAWVQLAELPLESRSKFDNFCGCDFTGVFSTFGRSGAKKAFSPETGAL